MFPGGVYHLSGSECSIGVRSPFVWDVPATLGADSTGLLWWVIVATSGSASEGSWGSDSSGGERNGPRAGGGSGECGIEDKDLSNVCEP